MKYLITKRFKTKAICGEVNLPYGTECKTNDNNIISYNGKSLCMTTSENAHIYFTINEDGRATERRDLIDFIQSNLYRDETKWKRVWEDTLICPKYKRKEHLYHWLWNHDFYNAPISDLEYIKSLIMGE